MPTLLLKYIIVGSSAVGKTCILAMFTEQQFKDAHDMTIGIEFGSREVALKDSIIKLEIWDTTVLHCLLSTISCELNTPCTSTPCQCMHSSGVAVCLCVLLQAGQESYLSITRSYYRGTDGCLLVYDMTNRESFTAATRWLHEARENSNNEHLVVMVIANKADLAANAQLGDIQSIISSIMTVSHELIVQALAVGYACTHTTAV
eukprot:5732-Heterococcus_DN1.PRE.1